MSLLSNIANIYDASERREIARQQLAEDIAGRQSRESQFATTSAAAQAELDRKMAAQGTPSADIVNAPKPYDEGLGFGSNPAGYGTAMYDDTNWKKRQAFEAQVTGTKAADLAHTEAQTKYLNRLPATSGSGGGYSIDALNKKGLIAEQDKLAAIINSGYADEEKDKVPARLRLIEVQKALNPEIPTSENVTPAESKPGLISTLFSGIGRGMGQIGTPSGRFNLSEKMSGLSRKDAEPASAEFPIHVYPNGKKARWNGKAWVGIK